MKLAKKKECFMSEYVLRTKGLSKRYGSQMALDNVGVEIRRGSIYGLIGLNGAGKSTFMRSVCGLITPTAGEVELFGRTGSAAMADGRRRIGQLIESPALYPNMSAAENLEMQRLVSGVPGKSRIDEILSVVGLEGAGRKKSKNFSLGMRQRLALGVALISNPEFLILDEPVNGLDPKGIIEMRELMRRLAEDRGITLLVSSHLLDELAHVATHFGIINQGRLIKQLSAEELAQDSRRYIRIVTDDVPGATALLTQNFAVRDFRAVSAGELRVYEQLERVAEMNAAMNAAGLRVSGIGVKEQELEDYFVGLISGGVAGRSAK
jgi:ABC-2 type transport system ATP-binding protein